MVIHANPSGVASQFFSLTSGSAPRATIELLLRYGADPTALNNEGETPAEWYRQFGIDEVADYMGEIG